MSVVRNTFIALMASGVLMVPAPASADAEDVARALVGIAAVGIIAKAIDDRKDRREEQTKAAERHQFRLGPVEQTGRHIEGRIRPYDQPRGKKLGVKKRPLPQECLRWVETARGDRLAYGARCLNRNYRHVRHLPDQCHTLVRTPRGLREVYGARCLEREGWRVARR
ncbi:hypothetical protein GQ651_09510 [Alphaproteobacteria bacterium GH1-50]|uniref:Uncharacterized protein n=1 Tax=Kangsaoukella pontilimi TaxID=2691042 RepID=A0A7C9NEC1_9RHOB|nr:hypothetical protein [Kangsaoukella pontilimi]MXQ08079.1 hypothetical protein [Kangsaoukella pontilimi]